MLTAIESTDGAIGNATAVEEEGAQARTVRLEGVAPDQEAVAAATALPDEGLTLTRPTCTAPTPHGAPTRS